MVGAVPPLPMAEKGGKEGHSVRNRAAEPGFIWVSPSPSPEVVASLEGRFPDIIQIPAAVLEEASSGWEKMAVLARTFSRWIPPDAIIREFRRGGVPGSIVPVSLAHRCHIFRFDDPSAQAMVMGRPWVANGQPIAIEGWRPEFIPAADAVATALLWVRLPNLPLEYWNDEILREILSPAGLFLFSDSATQQRSRGGFARACVRVDLRCSLRPGVRVRGKGSPFWQQYQFEHLEGICPKCGSIHLSGQCSSLALPSGLENDHQATLFGPWMSATRQRKSPPDHPVERKKSIPQSVPFAADDASRPVAGSNSDGWQVPGRVARRSLRKTGKSLASAAVDLNRGKAGSHEASVKLGVPVSGKLNSQRDGNSEHPRAVLQSESSDPKPSLIPNSASKKPFALLDMDLLVDGLGDSRDANPGPSKRPRPVEPQSPRIVSKSDKRKGKGVAATNSSFQDKGSDPKGMLPLSTAIEGRCHESVVSCLKLAIQGQRNDSMFAAKSPRPNQAMVVIGDSVENNQLMDCNSQKEEGATQSQGYLPGSTMLEEDQVGAPPPPAN